MTTWLPDLSDGAGPLYARLADRIERDIDAGILPPGAKLPPQRHLAFDIGVTIGTVSRAYALARERGLVSGEVGRGTYVRARQAQSPPQEPPATTLPASAAARTVPNDHLLYFDITAAPEIGIGPILERLTAEICRDSPSDVATYVCSTPPRWLEAGARWLACAGWTPQHEDVVPTLGAHAAVMAVIAATTAPGDRIAFEPLTTPPSPAARRYSAAARPSLPLTRKAPCRMTSSGFAPSSIPSSSSSCRRCRTRPAW